MEGIVREGEETRKKRPGISISWLERYVEYVTGRTRWLETGIALPAQLSKLDSFR